MKAQEHTNSERGASDNQDFWRLFVAEASELVSEVENVLLELENQRSEEGVDRLYRLMHTVKGNARIMGLSTIEVFTHRAEDVVGLCRDEGMPLSAEVVDELLRAQALLAQLIATAGASLSNPPPAMVEAPLARLTRIRDSWQERRGGCWTKRGATSPDSSTLPSVEDTLRFFETLYEALPAMEDAAEGVSSERPGASEQLSSVIAVVAGAAAPLGVRELDKALSEFDNASFRLDLPPAEAVLEAEIGLTRAIRETVEALLGCGSDAHRKIAVQFGERAVNRLRDAAFAVGGLLGGRASRELSQGDLALAKLALGRVARALALAGNLSAACLLWPLALSLPRAQESASLEDVGLFDLLAEFGERVTSAPDWQSAVGALEAQLCERAASRHEKASAGAAEEPPFGAVIGDDPEPPVRSGAPSISDRAAAGEGANEAAKVPTAAASSASKSEGLLRVSSSKVSQLVDLAGEIGLATGALLSREEVSASTTEGLGALAHRLENLVRELQDVSAALRLVQVGSVFQRLHRTVRDLARELGRPIRLEIRGEETEVDKLIVDRLFEPLLHMVRNAADHGLESPAERLGVGKPETGKITVSAVQQASEIHISVADDGRGLDRERILNRARERGLVEPGQEPKDDSAIWRLVLHPGFSTAEKVSALSGRGVGMDVVHSFVKDLRGRISIHSSVGKGTRFTLHVPLSLAFFQGMVFEASGMFFVIPVDSVSTVFRVSAEEVVRVGGSRGELLRLPDATVPVIWLQEFFRNVAGQREATAPTSEGRVVVVVHTAMGKLAIPTDVLMGNQQVIMKPLEGEMRAIRAAAGAGILHNGDVAIALDCERLADELRVVPTANAGSRTESYAPLG